MAKEKNKYSNNDGIKTTPPLISRRRKKKKWIGILLLLAIIGGIIFFRKPIMTRLRHTSLIEKFIPTQVDEERLSLKELRVKVNTQEQEIIKLKAEIKALEDTNRVIGDKNESLQQYEAMYMEFMAQKEAWDEEVAKTNTELFIKQFESIYPDTAERIYQTFKNEQILSDEQKTLSKTIGDMDEDQAAKALELLVTTDPELIQAIFSGMNGDQRALILGSMTSKGAAQVIKLISPDDHING